MIVDTGGGENEKMTRCRCRDGIKRTAANHKNKVILESSTNERKTTAHAESNRRHRGTCVSQPRTGLRHCRICCNPPPLASPFPDVEHVAVEVVVLDHVEHH